MKKASLKKRGAFNREEYELKAAKRFLTVLSVVSIIGFAGIASATLFNFDIENYVEAIWIFILGAGLLIEVRHKRLKSIATQGLNRDNFSNIITLIIGLLALLAGIFSIPYIRIENPAFIAIKGILAIIAITIIIIQTWYIDGKRRI